jgi:hypothetical protein
LSVEWGFVEQVPKIRMLSGERDRECFEGCAGRLQCCRVRSAITFVPALTTDYDVVKATMKTWPGVVVVNEGNPLGAKENNGCSVEK